MGMTAPGTPRPTLAAVALRAGVSVSTASLAFSGTGPVSEATRDKVLAAAEALDYAGPDPRARSLRRGRSGIVGVVIDGPLQRAFHDPVKVVKLDGIAEMLGTVGAGLLILTDADPVAPAVDSVPVPVPVPVPDPGSEPEPDPEPAVSGHAADEPAVAAEPTAAAASTGAAVAGVLAGGAPAGSVPAGSGAPAGSAPIVGAPLDGAQLTLAAAPLDAAILLCYSPRLERALGTLRSRGVPVVTIEVGDGLDGVVHISQDNRAATARGAQHLRELGHERVTVVTLPIDASGVLGAVSPERATAGSNAIAKQRLTGAWDVFPGAPAVSASGSSVDEGRAVGLEILAAPASQRPTAIIAQTDLLAGGIIRAAEQLGIAVPGELSVLGFDGIRVDGLGPAYELTTLVQPAFEQGRAAGEAVLDLLAGRDPAEQEFSPVFREGNTTAAPAR